MCLTPLGGTDIVEHLFISQAAKGAAGRVRDTAQDPLAQRTGLCRIIAALCVTSCLLSEASSVHADEASALTAESRDSGVIEITVVGSPGGGFRGVREAVIPHSFSPNIVRWLSTQRWDPSQLMSGVPADSDVRIRCWLVLSDPAHAHLYFADRPAKHFLIRNLELSGRFDELDREALSQALELSIRALLDNEEVGMNREETRALLAPETKPEQPTKVTAPEVQPPVPASPSGFSASASWQIEGHSRQLGVVQGPGLSLGYERTLAHLRATLWASGHYQLEKRYDSASAGLTLRTIALRSGVELVKPLPANSWFAGIRLGVGLDVAKFVPHAGLIDSSAALTPARSSTIPVVCGGALIGTELSHHVRLNLALFATVPLLALHYDVEVAGVSQRVATPWPVRPSMSLELAVH